jgi:hypothetical protein
LEQVPELNRQLFSSTSSILVSPQQSGSQPQQPPQLMQIPMDDAMRFELLALCSHLFQLMALLPNSSPSSHPQVHSTLQAIQESKNVLVRFALSLSKSDNINIRLRAWMPFVSFLQHNEPV